LTEIFPLNNLPREMQSLAARPNNIPYPETPFPRQSFQRAHASVGAVGPSPLLHLTRIGSALAPLVVLEVFKDPQKQYRWIRICSLVGAAVSETLWALREQRRREEREAQRSR
jgi:hypothetical protein